MKKTLIFIFISFCLQLTGQNIILNGEFSNLGLCTTCNYPPNTPSVSYPLFKSTHDWPEITKALGWQFGFALNLENVIGTADLYSAETPNSNIKIHDFPDCSNSQQNHPCHFFTNQPSTVTDINKNYAYVGVEGDNGGIMTGESLMGTLSTPLIPGETYVFKCSIISANNENHFKVQFRDSNNLNQIYLPHTFNNVMSGNITNQWLDLSYTFTVPVNSSTNIDRIELGGYNTGPFNSSGFFIDRVFLEPKWDGIDTVQGYTVCEGESVHLDLEYNPNYTYSWSPSSTLNNPNIHNPIASPTDNTIYTCTVSYGIQTTTINIPVTVSHGPSINLPSTIFICDGNFQEICGPIAPSGSTYSYQWYSTQNIPFPTSVLEGENMCFTPSQIGKHTLIVTDENGCTANHTINVLDEIPQPNLGNDITIECGQNPIGNINILNQGFDGSNYTITWFHNGQVIQQGGETLMTSITEGEVTVKVSVEGCRSVSDTIHINKKYCCPDDLKLVMDCKTKELRVENLPNNITVNTIFWDLNNQTIPNENNTTLHVTEEGIYSFGIIFTFPDGTECHHYIHFEYKEDYCCDITGSQAVVNMLGVTNYYNVPNTPYGPMTIPAMCGRVALDGSLSTCEDGYFISVAPFNPASWSNTNSPIFADWIQGQAPNNIDLTQAPFNLVFDNQTFYMIQFAVGPNWDDEYILFWYDCETKKEMVIAPNPNQGIFNVSMTNNEKEGVLEVIDLSGNLIYKGTIFKENPTEIDISRKKSGTYIVKVSIEGEVFSEKIIKE